MAESFLRVILHGTWGLPHGELDARWARPAVVQGPDPASRPFPTRPGDWMESIHMLLATEVPIDREFQTQKVGNVSREALLTGRSDQSSPRGLAQVQRDRVAPPVHCPAFVCRFHSPW